MPKLRFLPLLVLLFSAPALAGECEDNFSKQGNAFTGSNFRTRISLPQLSVSEAIVQMRNVALARNMDVLSQDAEGGSLLIEEPETLAHKPLPFIITASDEGGVTMLDVLLKLNKGALATQDGIRSEMCKMLGELASGRGASAPVVAAPSAMRARELSDQVNRQADDNRAAVTPRYSGKTFRLTGRAFDTRVENGKHVVVFDTFAGDDRLIRTRILCEFARNQAAYALTLREGENLDLTGQFSRFDDEGPLRDFILTECRPN